MAQESHPPIINVKKARAEFISNDFEPWFVVRGIRITGRIDTMKAEMHTSTLRSIGQDYARYKPVADSVAIISEVHDSALFANTGSKTYEVAAHMHLEGKGLPLPLDSVRGAVRLTISAAFRADAQWIGTTSEVFSVHVLNSPIPRPRVRLPLNRTVKIGNAADPTFVISGLEVSIPDPQIVDGIRDIREFELDDVEIVVASVKLTDNLLQKFTVNAVFSISEEGVPEVLCRIIAPVIPFKSGTLKGSITLSIRSRLLYRGVAGPYRSVPMTINVSG